MQGMGQANAQQAQADAKKVEAIRQQQMGVAEQGAKSWEADDLDRQREQVVSNQRAAFASSGGGVDGSARYVMDKTNQQGIYKRDMTIWEGAMQKQNRDINAELLRRESDALESAAKMSRISGIVSGISGVAGAFGGFGSKGGGGSSGGGSTSLFYG